MALIGPGSQTEWRGNEAMQRSRGEEGQRRPRTTDHCRDWDHPPSPAPSFTTHFGTMASGVLFVCEHYSLDALSVLPPECSPGRTKTGAGI